MRAAVLRSYGGPEAVAVQDVAEPDVGPGEVLIDVYFAGVVFPDLLMTKGAYQLKPPLPFIPGWEVAGVVRHDSGRFRAGDRVAAMPLVGGFAESVAVSEHRVFLLPRDFSLRDAAAVPLNYLTALFALRRRGRLAHGESVLVQGAGGGLGSACCQLAKAHGARVLAVVSSPEKAAIALKAGADEVLEARDFLAQARLATGGAGVDMVVDPVGGDRFADSLRSLGPEGRILVLGFTGRSIPEVKVNRLLLTNTAVVGVGWEEFAVADPRDRKSVV